MEGKRLFKNKKQNCKTLQQLLFLDHGLLRITKSNPHNALARPNCFTVSIQERHLAPAGHFSDFHLL
ncbi:hypothetical protein C0J52_01797 [Blattella germanica]|nr:hypothetical protein C0J52_01797 [Blattella germanica]